MPQTLKNNAIESPLAVHSNSNDNAEAIVSATKVWLDKVVIGLNFCPFAKKPFINEVIDYQIVTATNIAGACEALIERCLHLQSHDEIETSLMILAPGFNAFDDYLDLVDDANHLLAQSHLDDEFQLASFHPDYVFAGSDEGDAANYTNRSPYPIIHIIRNASIDYAFKTYPDPEGIPDRNIAVATEKGAAYFQAILTNLKK